MSEKERYKKGRYEKRKYKKGKKNTGYKNCLPEEFMRRDGEAFDRWVLRMLWDAYHEACKGKRKTEDEYRFERDLIRNLRVLQAEILERKYKPSRGIAFIVHEPVTREIFAAPFRDRVVHHFLYNMVAGWWDKRLIYDSYSCRKGKGVLMGQERLRKQENCALSKYKEPVYIIKMDLKGYFMSLPRKELYERVCWGLNRQFGYDAKGNKKKVRPREYYLIRYLWQQIIFDDPIKGVRKKGTKKEWEELPKDKSLFCQPPGVGIVIGNLSSQLLSNIYLDTLDRYIKERLGYKYYGRYVDDFYILVPESKLEQAKRDIKMTKKFLMGMRLKLHPKKLYIQDIQKGVEFLGARVFPNRILPGRRLVKNYRKAARDVVAGKKGVETAISYMGHCHHYKAGKIQEKIFEEVGWEYRR